MLNCLSVVRRFGQTGETNWQIQPPLIDNPAEHEILAGQLGGGLEINRNIPLTVTELTGAGGQLWS